MPGRGQAAARLGRLQLVPLVPRHGARVVRGPRDRRAHERALREREGRPRGAPGRRRRDDGGDGRHDRVGRLADDRLHDTRRQAVLRGHVLPARAAARDAELPGRPPRRGRGLAGAARRHRAAGERIDDALRERRRSAPVSTEPLDVVDPCGRRVRGIARDLRPGLRRVRRSAEVPRAPRRSSSSCAAGDEESLAMVVGDARRDGCRRDVRRRGRRLPPLLGRRRAGSCRTSRRCSTTTRCSRSTYLHAWVVTGRERYREIVEETARLRAPRARAPGRRARVRAGRGHRRRRGAHVHVDTGRGSRRGPPARAARAVRARPLRRSRRARARASRARCSPCARARPQPFRDDKALASWNGLALAALAEAGVPARADRLARAARELGEFLLGPLSAAGRAPLPLASVTARRAAPGSSTTTRMPPTASWSCTSRPASCAGCSRRAGSRSWRSSSSRTRSTAASSSRRGDGDARVPRTKELQDTPTPVGELDARVRAPAAREDLGRRRARAAGRLGLPPRRAGARARSRVLRVGSLRARPLAQRRRGRSRSSAPSTRPSRARRSRRSSRARSSRSARRTRCRCSRARGSSTASRPSTSASASSARRPCNRAGGAMTGVCLMIEGQEGVTWDDWVRLAPLDRGARARGALPLRSLHGDHPAADAARSTPGRRWPASPRSPTGSGSGRSSRRRRSAIRASSREWR